MCWSLVQEGGGETVEKAPHSFMPFGRWLLFLAFWLCCSLRDLIPPVLQCLESSFFQLSFS
jgi:hypothetical protein